MSITHIYNKDLQKLVSLNYSIEVFKKQPNLCYPDWTPDMYATEVSFRHPKIVNDSLEEKTRIELVEEGIEELRDGEVLRFKVQPLSEDNSQEKEIAYIPCPEGILKPKWVSPEWVEDATEEEIAEHNFKESVKFYNEELDFASKATAELACNIITEEMFEDVRLYMKAIDPYSQAKTISSIQRPSIFDRYN